MGSTMTIASYDDDDGGGKKSTTKSDIWIRDSDSFDLFLIVFTHAGTQSVWLYCVGMCVWVLSLKMDILDWITNVRRIYFCGGHFFSSVVTIFLLLFSFSLFFFVLNMLGITFQCFGCLLIPRFRFLFFVLVSVTSSSASLPNRTIAAVATASTVIISLVMTLFQRYVFKHW